MSDANVPTAVSAAMPRAAKPVTISLRRIALLATAVFLFAAPLLAQEGAPAVEEGFWTKHRVFWLINLVVFIAILVKAAGPAVVRWLEGKQQEIGHALAEADRRRLEAETMEQRIAAQIAELRREVDELATRSAREGERERDEILADAVREQDRIRSGVRAEIEAGLRQARQELTAHAARLAAQIAGERLETNLSREDRKQLFRDNVERLARKEA